MMRAVFVHGWGQSARIWCRQQAFSGALFLNLPGHGGAPELPAEQWGAWLEAQLPDESCVLVGWSLGGMLALDLAARQPRRLAGLALVATTPCFVERPGWPHGCDDATFAAFEQGVHAPEPECSRMLGRFFALMLHGEGLPRSRCHELARQAVDRQHPPARQALAAGLDLLAGLDLRDRLTAIDVPALVLHGGQDAIVPAPAGRLLAEALPNASWREMSPCGHAPFLSRADQFNETLEAWCRTL